MHSKVELVAFTGSGGDGASLPQRNLKSPIASLMPTQGPKSRPRTAQRLPSGVPVFEGSSECGEKAWGINRGIDNQNPLSMT